MTAIRFVAIAALWMPGAFGLGRATRAFGRTEFRLPDASSETGVPAQTAAVQSSADRFETAVGQGLAKVASADADHAMALELLKRAQAVLQHADLARDEGRISEAARMYETALKLYHRLANEYPEWQSGLVKFRQTYCEVQVKTLSQRKKDDSEGPSDAWQSGMAEPPTNVHASVSASRKHADPEPKIELTPILAKARGFLENGKTDEAIKTLLEGLRIDPGHGTLRLMVGLAQCQAGKFEDALFVLNPLIMEYPLNASAHLALGTAYFGLDRIDAARLALEQALNLDPELHAAHYNLAQIFMGVKPPDRVGARHHYQEALRLGANPDKELESRL